MDAAPPLTPLRRNRDFTLLQLGQGLSTLGSESSAIAYPLLVLALTHSPAKAGIVGFARFLPYPLFVLVAGVVGDRVDRRRIMVTADVVRVAAIATLVALLLAGSLTYPVVAAIAFVEGTAFAFFNVSELGALRSVVPPAQLPEAAAVEQARISSVFLAGPPVGGALFGLARAAPFVLDVVSYAFSLVTVLAMRTPFQEAREPRERNVRAEIREGFAWLWGRPFLRACALLFAGGNFAWEGLYLLLVVSGRRQGLSPATLGILIACYGGTSLLGSLVARRLQRLLSMRAIVVGQAWLALGVLAYVLEPNVWVLLAGAVPAAFASPTVNSVIIGYRTAVTPDRLQGRVTSVARLFALAGGPLGPLAAGFLIEATSARATVALVGAWFAGLALAATASPSIRQAPSLRDLSPDAA